MLVSLSQPEARRERLLAAHQRNPCWTLARLGQAEGITRQRVHQLLAKEGIHLATPTYKSLAKAASRHCRLCGLPLSRETRYDTCSSCRQANAVVMLPCEQCGRLFPRRGSQASYRIKNPRYRGRFFCSLACNYQWRKGRPRGLAKRFPRLRQVLAIYSQGPPHPTIRELARRLGCSHNAIGRDRLWLRAAGFLAWEAGRHGTVHTIIPLIAYLG